MCSEVVYPEKGDEIPLDSNENLILRDDYYDDIHREMRDDLSVYPSPTGLSLRKKLAELYELDIENVVVGNGSDAILDTIYKTMVSSEGIIARFVPSYEMYSFFARRNERRLMDIPLNDDFTIPNYTDFDDDVEAVLICSPNNPTGMSVDRGYVTSLLKKGKIVIVDEAYGEYSSEDCIDLLQEYDNLIIVRTFSKAWGLAGIRVGYSLASYELSDKILSTILPYNVNVLSLNAAISAIDHRDMVEEAVRVTKEERQFLTEELKKQGFEPFTSQTNFVFSKTPYNISSGELSRTLLKRGFRIRTFDDPVLKEYIRITVADRKTNQELLKNIREIVTSR